MTLLPVEAAARRRGGKAGASIPAELGFEGIGRVFGSRRALDQVGFTISPAEVVCLLGASGCGKTTLLRIAAGIDKADEGAVLVDGKIIADGTIFVPPERRSIGMVFQDYALFPHMTVVQNVMFGLNRMPRAEARLIALQGLERVGLSHLADAFPHRLSGGEQQRVALARAVAPRPRMLLMDEPFSNLDRRMRDAVRDDTVQLLRETGVTTMIVTHDPEEAMRIADRIVLMRAGRIEAMGSADDLYHKPANLYAARFFAEMNEIAGIVEAGHVTTAVGRFAAPGLTDGSRAVVCIRPQGIRADGGIAGIPMRVLTRRSLGEVDLVELDGEGIDKPIKARLRHSEAPSKGALITIAVDPQEALVFAAVEQ
jgi:iron(III) transport system ATP-binding protein